MSPITPLQFTITFFRCFSKNEMPASLSFEELVDFITEDELPFDVVSLMRVYTITKKNI